MRSAAAAAPSHAARWPYAALALLAFAIYANSLANGFVVDDNGQILRNPLVTDFHRIPDIFSQDVWSFLHPEAGALSNYYRPVHTLLSMALYYLFGFNAFFFHLAMVLLHVANTLLVFRVSRYFLRETPAMIAAALFAVHPIHDEAVAWIAVMPDVLLTLMALGMIAMFIRQHGSPRGWQLPPYAAIFLAAMLTKETSATILPLLAAFEFLYLGRSVREMLKNFWFYASLAATFVVYLAMRMHALGSLAPAQGGHFSIHGATLALSMIVLMGQYFWRLIVPTNLSYFHVFEPTHTVDLAVIASLAAILLVIWAIVTLRRTRQLVSYGLFFVVIPLLPVMNINGVGENVFTERYLYLPSVGFVWIAALGWEWLYQRNRNVAYSAFTIVAVISSYMVISRTRDWHDDFTINVVTARQYPQVAVVHMNLGAYFGEQGRVAEGIAECRKAIALDPHLSPALVNLGQLLEAQGHIDEATAAEEEALRWNPRSAEALNELAVLKLASRDFPAAMDFANRAVAASPRYAKAYMNVGIVYANVGEYGKAIASLQKAIELGPRDDHLYFAHYSLGIAFAHLVPAQREQAAAEFQKALELKPTFAPAQQELDRLRATQ